MTPFEAINHSMSLIPTGGFSTSDASLGHWVQPGVHWVAVVIMILGSLPLTLYVATLRGHRRILLKDHQVRGGQAWGRLLVLRVISPRCRTLPSGC